MNYFELTDIQLSAKEVAREFAQTRLLPGVLERDKHMHFPDELVSEMGALGLLGMMVDSQYEGGGMDAMSYALAIEEIAKVDASAAVIMSVNNSLVCHGLQLYGSQEQKQKYLGDLATGRLIGSFCLSEPDAGSDATQLKTQAEDHGDYYILQGTKIGLPMVTGPISIWLWLKPIPLSGTRVSILSSSKKWPGITIGPKEDKMGIRASDTTSINYDQVKVPKENRIGPDGHGFKFALNTLDGGRIGIAAQALGIAAGLTNAP